MSTAVLFLVLGEVAPDALSPAAGTFEEILQYGVLGTMFLLFTWAMLTERLVTGRVYQRRLVEVEEWRTAHTALRDKIDSEILPQAWAATSTNAQVAELLRDLLVDRRPR